MSVIFLTFLIQVSFQNPQGGLQSLLVPIFLVCMIGRYKQLQNKKLFFVAMFTFLWGGNWVAI